MITRIALLAFAVSSIAYSQPYYYYFAYNPDYDVPGYSGDIYRLNLSTNSNALFAKNVGRVNGRIFSNTNQSEIFFQVRFSLVAMDVSDPSRHERELLSGVNEIDGIKDSPQTNRYFITFDDEQDSTKTVIIDRSTMQPLDTIGESFQYNPFCSKDNKTIYRFQPDSTGILFSRYIISSKESELPRRCGTMVPVESFVILNDAKDGLALVSYEDNARNDFSGVEYVLCDVDKNTTFSPIAFPWRSKGYLSSDGKYAILEQVNYDTALAGGEYYTGIVYVFDASTGEFMQRLTLPPNGEIFTFDNYPRMLYYYNDSTNQAIAISDTVVTPPNALIDTLISLKHQAVAKGWLRDNRDRGHDIDEMMRGNEWYKEGEFKKFRSWEVGKDWKFDHDWNEGIVEVLDRRLDMAKRALDRGDSVTARRNLEIFVMEVELLNNLSTKLLKRGEEPVITSQGYLSLKFNAEYVIDRLPERHSEGSGRGRRDKR